MESFLAQSGSWLGFLGTIGLTLAGYLANRYVIPFLKIGRREMYAGHIATIADDLTDDLRQKYPEKHWLKHLDEAVDSLIVICGIEAAVAKRAINAAAARK